MIVLGIETSTARSSVAALVDGTVAYDEHHEDARGHGAFLAPALQRCLDTVGGAAGVGLIAVGTGPGLYTGLRVGMATAAAFASARSVPVIGVGGLEVLARMAQHEHAGMDMDTDTVVTTLDARRGQVFWAVHGPGPQGDGLHLLDGPHVGAREQLEEVIAEHATRTLSGSGSVHVVGEIGSGAADGEVMRPEAKVLVQLAAERMAALGAQRAAVELTPAALEAVYLRDADVRVGWNERGGVRAGLDDGARDGARDGTRDGARDGARGGGAS
jgi:tRNA threonylcarbamoyladenosine biosynthesis protein TsaB